MTNRVFLEKSRFIEIVAHKFNIKSSEINQSKRKSPDAMTKKASDDYRLLINKITCHLCHSDKDVYENCDYEECRLLSGVLSKHGLQFFSLYDFIAKQNIDISVEPHLVRMAVLDIFILPYLMRVVSELKEKFNKNRTLWYLNEYIEFIARETSKSEPLLKTFLREHVKRVPCGLFIDKTRYEAKTKKGRPEEYQSWTNFFVLANDDELNQVNNNLKKGLPIPEDDKKRWTEARSWHCAGNIIYQLFRIMNVSGKHYAPWRNRPLTTRLRLLRWEYDFLYDSFLSLNRDMQFSLFRSDKVKLNLIISNRVECYLTLDRKSIQDYLSKEATFGISLPENALIDVSLKQERKIKSSKPKKIAFDKYLKQPSALNLRFDYTAQRHPGDDDAEFNITPRGEASIDFVVGVDGRLKLALDKNTIFDLRSNKAAATNLGFENAREHGYEELRSIFTAFKYAIHKRNVKGISLTEIEELSVFCKAALNGKPMTEDIKKEEGKLRELLKDGHSNRYTSFLAWCIFIAKCKHGKLKNSNEMQYCESKIIEHQDDYVGNRINEHIHQLKHRAIHADFKRDVLYRLGYIRVYNKLVMGDFERRRPRAIDKLLILDWRIINAFPSNDPRMLSFLIEDRYTGDVINPFVELEKYIDSILQWDSCCSPKVVINEPAFESYPKSTEKSLNWLISPNVSSNYKQENPQHDYTKMRLCRTCSVRLYPELMTLAGLRHNPKIASLKEHEFERLISLLKPCQCRTINDFELTENMETGNTDTRYWVPDYYSKSISF